MFELYRDGEDAASVEPAMNRKGDIMNERHARIFCLCLGMIFLAVFPANAKDSDIQNLMGQDISSLLNTPVAMLTQSKAAYVPASITTITEEQIEATPARNIYDLMEIYVPGAIWVTHSESPHIGIRGVISDRNNKIILLVNGRKVNENAHSGAIAELEQWDLHDIKKIEIIRGPGAVTYGPGAIEGVISITTKNAEDAPGVRAGVQYVSDYNSSGAYISDGVVKKDSNFYMYGSIVHTEGIEPKEFFATADNKTGYLGQDGSLGNREALDYFNDAGDIPQVKLYADYKFGNGFDAWARYTNSGSSRHGSMLNTKSILSTGEQVDLKENKDQMAVVTLENKHEFNDVTSLDSMISLSSIDHFRRDNVAISGSNLNPNVAAYGLDEDSMQNVVQAFSETELLTRSILNYTAAEKYKFAVGFENSYEHFGPGWGASEEDFRMGDGSNLLGSLSSAANNPGALTNVVAVNSSNYPYIVGDGWYENTFSFLTEGNFAFDPKFNVILSGRTDKNALCNTLFSPRVAVVDDWEKMGITKFIWQKSVRMNTAEQLYLTKEAGQKNLHENLVGYEFIYDVSPVENLSTETSVYYNSIDVLGWSNASSATVALGTEDIFGWELDAKYKYNEKLTLGGNQSYTELVKFRLGSGQTRSGISYSDYNTVTSYPSVVVLTSTGDNLNNWPNVATKFYADYKMTPKWTFHTDARIFWGFDGGLDGLDMLEAGAQGNANQAAIDDAINSIREQNAYKTDARLDASVRYALSQNTTVTFLVWNLLGLNGNKRYTYDAGLSAAAPNRATWIDEPRVYGVKVDSKF